MCPYNQPNVLKKKDDQRFGNTFSRKIIEKSLKIYRTLNHRKEKNCLLKNPPQSVMMTQSHTGKLKNSPAHVVPPLASASTEIVAVKSRKATSKKIFMTSCTTQPGYSHALLFPNVPTTATCVDCVNYLTKKGQY